MIDSVRLKTRVQRVMDKIFEFADGKDITFYSYKGKYFIPLKDFCDSLVDSFEIDKTNVKHIVYFKNYKKRDACVMFTLLLNDEQINDVNYQYDNMSNYVSSSNNNVDALKIVLNCQYTNYSEFLKTILSMIGDYLKLKNNNGRGF